MDIFRGLNFEPNDEIGRISKNLIIELKRKEGEMEQWHKTGCVLCSQNCGLEIFVENNKITKVGPMRENPRSKGYICRKGLNVANYQHHSERLTHPLKKTGGGFVKISWEQAFTEISEKLLGIIEKHGPKSFAFMGGGGQGGHFDSLLGIQLMRALGSRYHYNPLAQELTGYYWICGRALGKQNIFPIADKERADMIVAIGWNAMESHQMPRAPKVMHEFSKNPEKLLVVIDPRKTKLARIADMHIPVRPGTDALLTRAMIAIILKKGWENREYITSHVSGWEQIKSWFENFDVQKALAICELEYDLVEKLCHLLATRRWCMHAEMGVLMNRHSTVVSYLHMILMAICGRLLVSGGNVIPGRMVPLGVHTDEREEDTWRTQTTNFPAITGFFPPNVMPEEILSDHPDRLRAVITSSSNPLRSYADTNMYEQAFQQLELLVTIELSMTETAALADYVLPAKSGFEAWDGTFFPLTYPEIYFQMRKPILQPDGLPLECGEIFMRLADKMGLIPHIPDALYEAAKKDRLTFAMALAAFVQTNPQVLRRLPFVVAKTLGKEMGSVHLSLLWGVVQQMMNNYNAPDGNLMEPDDIFLNISDEQGSLRMLPHLPGWISNEWLKKHLYTLIIFSRVRSSTFALDVDCQGVKFSQSFKKAFSPKRTAKVIKTAIAKKSYMPFIQLSPRAALSESLFQAILDHREGLFIGKSDPDNFKRLRTKDGKICVYIPELENWIKSITPESEEKALALPPDFPFILSAGSHMYANANTLMRNPAWNKNVRGCTLLMHPEDADNYGMKDGDKVRIATEGGTEKAELEITPSVRKGQVILPHGFGLRYEGKTHGTNANRLTKNTNRDRWAATPYHRFVPCRVELISDP